jgi:hypothetical protein
VGRSLVGVAGSISAGLHGWLSCECFDQQLQMKVSNVEFKKKYCGLALTFHCYFINDAK